jgi:hypothetical protein
MELAAAGGRTLAVYDPMRTTAREGDAGCEKQPPATLAFVRRFRQCGYIVCGVQGLVAAAAGLSDER